MREKSGVRSPEPEVQKAVDRRQKAECKFWRAELRDAASLPRGSL